MFFFINSFRFSTIVSRKFVSLLHIISFFFFGNRLCNIFSVSVFLRHSVPFCLHVTYSQFCPEICTCWYCIVNRTIIEPDDDDYDDDEEGFIHPFCFSFMRSCSSWVVKFIYIMRMWLRNNNAVYLTTVKKETTTVNRIPKPNILLCSASTFCCYFLWIH